MARSIGTMVRLSLPGLGRQFCLAGSVIAVACLAAGVAAAQGKLDARYTATLTGVQIGKGAWVIEIAEDQFTAAASGMTTGLLRVFANGNGSGASRGLVRGDNLIPATYASRIDNDKRVEELRIVLSAGAVKEVAVDPPSPPNPDRIPLSDAHRRGVVDPMSAGLLRVAGSGDPVSPEACRRTVPVFDGRMRFDLVMSFKRIEKVQAGKGYQGPVAVCGVQFVPLAGFVPDRPAIKYLIAQRDMEVWLAPIAGTRVVVPYRLSLQTPFGLGVLEATQFVSVATQPRPPPAAAAAR
jgi:Protein of unknown function (DUF3108)